MKNRPMIAASAMFVLSIVIGFTLFSNPVGTRAGLPPPTLAPSRTPGSPSKSNIREAPTLEKPLTKNQALQIAYAFDQQNATWENPWLPDNADVLSGRVKVESSYTQNDGGANVIPKNKNLLWIITVKGNVRWNGFKGDSKVHDGMVYRISRKTGSIISYRIGITK